VLILKDLSAEVPDTNAFHMKLEEFSEEDNRDTALMYGYDSAHNKDFHERCRDFKRKIYFNNWAPCEFAHLQDHNGKTPIEYDDYFDEIYSICPYTSKWLNDKKLGREYKPIFYPFCQSLIPPTLEKQYDVIYHGGIHGKEHIECLKTMVKFNYRFCTMTNHINQLTMRCLPYATNANLNFQEKINLIAKTKISVCYNLVHLNETYLPAIKTYDRWEENEAFNTVGRWNVLPQFKTRMHEAAISHSVNLVFRDEWNVVEDYYEPDKEFLYFENREDLENKIVDIVNDWESYQEILENAYTKAQQYTTTKFIERIEEDGKN
jgi:hypothetical protein|tara:strand:+ start:690 stop:1649 length:960 start_codon:yes stop_codon:yes gene_type:complete